MEEEEVGSSENGKVSTAQQEQEEEHNVVKFLDSMDSYLTLLDSLSSTLRQGWLELASARHSMGASRINSTLFDLKHHAASTSLQVTQNDVDSIMTQPHFTLCKWASPDNKKCCSEKVKFDEDELLKRKSTSPQLRHRGTSQYSEIQEKRLESNGSSLTVDNQVQKERSKSLSMFGALVSPKLRVAQFSFETALEALVEIANMRSSMLSTYDQVQKELESRTG
uniref:Vacuolar ATPase assembly protein VMA22 n=1 Tax=Davidia involucrata TaxID=16924 RepID=A0A5B7BCK6_DAVIN